jgi:transcriptional repressor NrdR
MLCPICGHDETSVVDSRLSSTGDQIRRRRECDTCHFRFSTVEEMEILDITVVKRNGHRENYSREKLERGLHKALEKRSHTEQAFRGLVQAIEREIQREKSQEMTSARIGEIVMMILKGFDKVAYIRFASVYKSFEDVETFQQALAGLAPLRRRSVRKTTKKQTKKR